MTVKMEYKSIQFFCYIHCSSPSFAPGMVIERIKSLSKSKKVILFIGEIFLYWLWLRGIKRPCHRGIKRPWLRPWLRGIKRPWLRPCHRGIKRPWLRPCHRGITKIIYQYPTIAVIIPLIINIHIITLCLTYGISMSSVSSLCRSAERLPRMNNL